VAGVLSEPATVSVSGTPASVNAANQFAGTAQAGTGTQSFTVVATDPSGNTRTNTYQVTVSGTAQSLVYDANGNLCAKGGTTCTSGTTTYDWDAENRLVDVKQGATTLASFAYDGRGVRVQKTAGGVTHSYVYEGANILEERFSSGQTYDYVQGPGLDRTLARRDQAGAVSYYLADYLGSIAQTTNSAGTATLTREYDPWGNLLQGSGTVGYAFTGREWDSEVSAYYYRARYYDPVQGRFMSEDPLGLKGGPNRYAYVSDNPLNLVDPTGLIAQVWCRPVHHPVAQALGGMHCFTSISCAGMPPTLISYLGGGPNGSDIQIAQNWLTEGSNNDVQHARSGTFTPYMVTSPCKGCDFEKCLVNFANQLVWTGWTMN